MKPLLFFTTTAMMFMVGCIDSTRGEVSLSKYKGHIVVEKDDSRNINDGTIYAHWVYLEKDGETTVVRTTQYWFSKYNMGDTIK